LTDKIARMVANNAAWIDMALTALGIGGEFTSVLWHNTNDMPPVFPNADILGGTEAQQLAAIEELVQARARRVVAVKDAWARLDLTPMGFEVLFEAQWLYRDPQLLPPSASDLQVERVTSAEGLRDFALACNGPDISVEVYSPALLNNPDVVWLVGKQNDNLVAGVTSVRAQGLNGINNLFGATEAQQTQMLRAAVNAFPDLPACGYEGAESIPPYIPLGFQTVGPLKVWLRLPTT